jgi:hypothetical protein
MRWFVIALLLVFTMFPVYSEEAESVIKETYTLEGLIEYDDNPVEVIYLDEEIEKPQVNIQQRSLTLPVGMLNITSNTNSQRSALARASVNRGSLKDILPLSGSVTEQFGYGLSYGQLWTQEMSNFGQMENTTAFFVRYDSPRWFSFTTSMRQSTNQDIGTYYNLFRLAPELHLTDTLTLKDSFTNYVNQSRYKNEVTLVYTPALKKYAESLKFELGVAQTYYQTGRQRNSVEFSTGFKL